MRKYFWAILFADVFNISVLHAQTNIPTSATGPSSATPKLLPTYYPEISKYYLRTYTPIMPTTDSSQVTMSATVDNVNVTTQYYDYLSRPAQTVIKQASPLKKDYVMPVLIDSFNRISMQYLPYVQQTSNYNDGKYKQNSLQSDSAYYTGMFSGEQIFYGQKIFDGSPLQRVTKVTAVGNSWTGAGRGISYSQRANATSDSVRLWTIAITSEDDVPSTSVTYNAGSLFVEEVTDERGVKGVSYKDELGRTILTKMQVASSPSTGHAGWLCTYYVYDEMNHLRMVITPKAVEALNNGTVNWDLTYSSGAINTGLCYAYYYDDRGRVTMKRVPGRGKSYIAYDLFDRVVMTQDSNLRQTNQWAFVKYDGQSRPYRSGVITTTLSKDSVIAQAARSSDYPTLSGTYTIMNEAYFDDYSWTSGTPLNSTLITSNINSTNFITSYNSSPQYAQQITASSRIRGAATGSKKLILGTSNYLYTLILYDEFGRTIQVKETNYSGGTDVLTAQYNFAGLTLRTHLLQQKSGTNAQTHTLLTKYNYDHVGRLKSIIKNIDSTTDKTVSTLAYTELGQLLVDTLGNNLTSQNYKYNIRGWLSSINKSFVDTAGNTSAYFGESLSYDWGFTNNQYNGAIAGGKWKSGSDGIARAYGFTYDNANRLTVAEFSQQNDGSTSWTNDKVDFTTNNLTYDAGGNILTMRQRGISIGVPTTIDSLNYQYATNSNQLQNVTDLSSFAGNLGDFKDTTISGVNDYTYDANGNIVKDYNRKMYTASNGNGAVYNLLDKPDSIAIPNKATVYYYYDASGMMLSKKVNDYSSGSLVSKTYLYLNGFVYLNDSIQYILYEEGRIRYNKDSAKFFYDYFLKDHLGNVRTVLTEEQRTDAYPPASLETAQLSTERLYYSKVDSGRVNKSTVSGYPTDTYTSPNDYIQKLNGNGVKIGTGIVLKVMSGDQFNIRVSSWWNSNNSPGTPVSPLSDLLSALNSGVSAASNGHFSVGDLSSNNTLSPGATSFLNSHSGYNTSKPKAFVNWILFDEQFNYVSASSGFQQVGADTIFTVHTPSTVSISKSGYFYVYVSNETPNIDVFFDNLQVTHIRGPLLQVEGYYPFGLEMQGISSNALNFGGLSNAYKFNGSDEWEESINLYSTFFRGYDQQLGRFNGVDILSEQSVGLSQYQFGGNNPIAFNDPTGALKKTPDQIDGGAPQWYLSDYMQRTMDELDQELGYENALRNWIEAENSGGGSAAANLALNELQPNYFNPSTYMYLADGTNPFQRVVNAINKIIGYGLQIDDVSRGYDSKGHFGITIGFSDPCGATDPDGKGAGVDFVRLPEFDNLPSIVKPGILGMVDKFLDMSGTTLDLTRHGFIGAQQLANRIAGTEYELLDIGKYKLLRLGKLGTLSLKGLGDIAGATSEVITLIDIGENGLNWNNGTDFVVGAVTLLTPAGWVVGGLYFFSNELIKSLTGKSIGDWSKEAFKGALRPSNWGPITNFGIRF